jgi:Flp pilus assembly protein CpaB
MSSVAPRRHVGLHPLLLGLVLLFGVVGVGLTLWHFGIVNLPFLSLARAAVADDPKARGLVPLPISAKAIPAYSKITRDDVWDPANTRLTVVWLPREQVKPDMMQDLKDVLGRVLDHDKPPGYVFTESDFLPRGTRPGIVGGIPSGKRAVRIEANTVPGLFGLSPGDHFDLLSALPIEAKAQDLSHMNVAGNFGPQLAMEAAVNNWMKRATVKVIVQNGVVVTPVTTRQVPFTQNSLTQGTIVRSRPVQELMVAVEPGEVAPLMEAIAIKSEITCVPRSGRPDEPPTSVTPESTMPSGTSGVPGFGGSASQLFPELTVVETINGTKREMTAVPVSKDKH